jgi:hypothetical protein
MDLLAVSFSFHTVGIVIWTGVVLLLPLGIIPAWEAMDVPAQHRFLRILVQWWGPLLMVAALVVGVTGWIQTVGVEDVNEPVLIVKHCVVVLLLIVNGYIVFGPGRKLIKMEQATEERKKVVATLKRACWIQAVVGLAVLIVVGVLMV